MRFLICARHYPPLVSGGARRPFILARGLRELGHQVDVLAPALPSDEDGFVVPHVNPEMASLVIDAKKRLSAKAILRQLLYWPDADIRWAWRAKRLVGKKIKEYDVVITSSPPESIHALGAWAKKTYKGRWAADLRDNWLIRPLNLERQRRYRQLGEAWLARRWLRHADLVMAPTQFILQEAKGYVADGVASFVLPQACEAMETKQYKQHANGVLRLFYGGSFSLSDPERHVELLLDFLMEVQERNIKFHLTLIGRLTEREAKLLVSRLGANIDIKGVQPRGVILAMLHRFDALVLCTASNTRAVPGKLAEFRAAQKPILFVGGNKWFHEAGIEVRDALQDVQSIENGTYSHVFDKPPLPVDVARLLIDHLSNL